MKIKGKLIKKMEIAYKKSKKKNFRECPCCKDRKYTIKYRDEDNQSYFKYQHF